jgi:hypothetical protein
MSVSCLLRSEIVVPQPVQENLSPSLYQGSLAVLTLLFGLSGPEDSLSTFFTPLLIIWSKFQEPDVEAGRVEGN